MIALTAILYFGFSLVDSTCTGAWTRVLLFSDSVEGTIDKIMSSVLVFAPPSALTKPGHQLHPCGEITAPDF
ncbi:hypothetical protein BJV78DRAFT_1175723 [Lactifluus subvellereus]|nr:hypothetical protein BJV78DRAFT_1175723 [Lactifluus subvellereus]